MILSRAKHVIASKIRQIGTQYSAGDDTFYGILLKSNVGQDVPRSEYKLLLGHAESYTDGEIVHKGSDRFIPTQRYIPNLVGEDVYQKIFLSKANASGDLKHYDSVAVGSTDRWDVALATTASTGWIIQKNNVWAHFTKLSLRAEQERIGQIESGDFIVLMPWSINASFSPVAECRFMDRQGRSWKIEDVDDKTYMGQAYLMRVSADDR